MAKGDKIGAHGKSRNEMKELHRQQLMREAPKMIPANGNDAGDYKVKEAEKDFVHVQMELANFDQSTGAKLSKPYVQLFGPDEYLFAKQHSAFSGYKTKILHNPSNSPVDLGSSTEGARKVDSNYAQMQERYEALTGERPADTLTENELNAAILVAEKMHTAWQAKRANGPAPAPIKDAEIETTAPPLIIGTPAQMAVAPVSDAGSIADAAKEAAANTPPTGDGSTSVGQQTESAKDADNAEKDAEKDADKNAPDDADKNAPDDASTNSKDDSAKKDADDADKDKVKVPAHAKRGAAPQK